jgi:hypothetical protein
MTTKDKKIKSLLRKITELENEIFEISGITPKKDPVIEQCKIEYEKIKLCN